MVVSRLLLAATTVMMVATAWGSTDKVVVAEAQYLMADGDTLAAAEQKVLDRAKRRAVEEAGVYLESTFRDSETEKDGRTAQVSALEIRTIAAAITETEILESRRSFEQDRPKFWIRIRATVSLDSLEQAIRRLRSEERLARHFRQLQKENTELRAQLQELQTKAPGVRTLVIVPEGRSEARQRAQALIEAAVQAPSFREKIDLASQAVALDARYVDALIIRGQTYLQMVSDGVSEKSKRREWSGHLKHARADFDRALALEPTSAWAWLGRGDAATWLKHIEDAAQAYERALEIDPLFDVARQRLITLYTTQARKQVAAKRWHEALATLQNLLRTETPESWLPYQKEAYLLRSQVFAKLNQPDKAIEDLSMVLRFDSTNGKALLARARLYQKRLQGSLAREDLERACVLGVATACTSLP